MINEWGESIAEEGVFSETALGAAEMPSSPTPQYPNVNQPAFPYAPTPQTRIEKVGLNRYAVIDVGADAPVRQATAGMGTDPWDIDAAIRAGWTGSTPEAAIARVPESAYHTQYGSGSGSGSGGFDAIFGAVGQGVGAAMGVASGVLGFVQRSEEHDLRMQALQQQLDQNMQLFQRQLSSGGTSAQQAAQLQALLNQARSASASGDLNQMLLALQAMQSASRTWVPWVVGGLAVVLVGGLVAWLVTREDNHDS